LPSITFEAATPAPNAAGWNNTTVSVPFTVQASTYGAELPSPTSPLTFTTAGKGQTQIVKTTSLSDLTATATSPPVNIDLTPPVSTATTNGVTLTLSATDDLSGVAGTWYTLNGGTAKQYTSAVTLPAGADVIAYWSVDVAGNTETAHTLDYIAP
jgi:hypothetical protein